VGWPSSSGAGVYQKRPGWILASRKARVRGVSRVKKPSIARVTAHLGVIQRLSSLYGVLPATRPFPGKEKVREQVGQALVARPNTRSTK
jgi:hypothetical protein